MPTLVPHNGNRMAVDSAEAVHGVFVANVPGGGRVFIPQAQVRRIEQAAAPASPEPPISRPPSDSFISPGLGRPTNENAPYALPSWMPVAQPPGAERIDLGFRSDPSDYSWAARKVTEYGDPEDLDLFRRAAAAYNASNPMKPIDPEQELAGYQKYWEFGR